MRKTRLCSLLLALSMVLTMSVLFVTPAMAEDAVSNAPVAPTAPTPAENPDIWDWEDSKVATSFAGGTGVEGDAFEISTPAQLALLAQQTYFFEISPYIVWEGEHFIPKNIHAANHFQYDGNDYYVVDVDGVSYLFCTTDGSTQTISASLTNHTTTRLVDKDGNAYYVDTLPGKNGKVSAYQYDETTVSLVLSDSTVFNNNNSSYHLGDNNKGAVLTVDADHGVFTFVAEGHAFNGKQFVCGIGQTGSIERKGDTYYYWVNTPENFDHKLYKLNSDLAFENDIYTIDGAVEIVETTTAGDLFKAYFELTNDIYLNDPMDVENTTLNRWTPLKSFNGHINGNNHTIFGLYCFTETAGDNLGFCKQANGASFSNLKVAYAVIESKAQTHNAVLVATTPKGATTVTFNNCHIFEADMKATYSYQRGNAGFVADAINVTISDSSFDGHIKVSGPGNNGRQSFVAGMVGGCWSNAGSITIKNSVVSGIIEDTTGNVNSRNVAAFVANEGKGNTSVLLENCVNYADLSIVNGTAAPFIGNMASNSSGRVLSARLLNCINYGNVTATGSSAVASGLVGTELNGRQTTAITAMSGLRAFNCANYGTISSDGVAGGLLGEYGSTSSNRSCFFRNCLSLGEVKATTETGIAGGVIGKIDTPMDAFAAMTTTNNSSNNTTTLQYNWAQFVLHNVYYTYAEKDENGQLAGLPIGNDVFSNVLDNDPTNGYQSYKEIIMYPALDELKSGLAYPVPGNVAAADCVQKSGEYGDCSFAVWMNDTTLAQVQSELNTYATNNATLLKDYNCTNSTSANYRIDYPETNWQLDASAIQGASLELGNSVAINLYSEAQFTFDGWSNHDNKVVVTVNGETKELANLGYTKINGKDYFHYQLPVNPAEIGDTFTFTLNGNSINYGVETYAKNKYVDGTSNLDKLLYALMTYGDAARVNASKEAKSLQAVCGQEYDAEALGVAFDALTTIPEASDPVLDDVFASASLNLNGNINLLVKLEETATDVKQVRVTFAGKETVLDVVKNGQVVFAGIVATALNTNVKLEALDAEGQVVDGGEFNWTVAQFVSNTVNTQPKVVGNLAQALALYMKAARVYTGLDAE